MQGRAGLDRAEQGEVSAGEWEQLLLCDTLYQPKTHWFKFPSRYSIGLPRYGLNKNSLTNLSKGCNSKYNKTV